MLGIEDFFLKSIMTNPDFLSTGPVHNVNLLLPAFFDKVQKSILLYKQSYPAQDIFMLETYRSNTLQEIYFNRGASKLKKDGMHHFGIACDCMFVIDGQRTFKGDVELLRRIHEFMGLTILGMWDSLHVQYIPVGEQQALRAAVTGRIATFQKESGLPVTSEPDGATITEATNQFPRWA